MSFSPLKKLTIASLFLASLPAYAAGSSGAGACGGAPYKSGLFAPRLNQIDKRMKDLCGQEKSAAKRLNSLSDSCGDASHKQYVDFLVKRGDQLCEKGQRSVKETVKLCQDYDQGVASSKAGLGAATTGTRNQSDAFNGRSNALQNASSQMSSVAGSAGAVSKRLQRYLPEAKSGQAASTDPEIKQIMDKYRSFASASPAKKASCKQLKPGMEQLATLLQQNIMPNLRVVQEGVAGINENASKSASSTASASFQDKKTADKLTESHRANARVQPMNQVNPRVPANASGAAPAINQAPNPNRMRKSDQEEILNNLSSYN